jgi:hypothetical protein
MNVPEVKDAQRYVGLYAVDFGDHSAVGLAAEEVAELLDSEANADATVYKIYRAYPDGRMEIVGVRREVFGLEAGVFFYARDEQAGRDDFDRLCGLAESVCPPTRAKVQFASDNDSGHVTALIYPAEWDQEFSRWLLDGGYRTAGMVEAGTGAVERYYAAERRIFERRQLWGASAVELLKGSALRDAVRKAVVR